MSEPATLLLMHLGRGAVATMLVVLLTGGLAKLLRVDAPRTLRWVYAAALLLPLLSPLASFPLRITIPQPAPARDAATATALPASVPAASARRAIATRTTLAGAGVLEAEDAPRVAAPAPSWQWSDLLPYLSGVLVAVWLAGFATICLVSGVSYACFLRRLDREHASIGDTTCHSDWVCHWRRMLSQKRIRSRIPLMVTTTLGPCLVLRPNGYVLAVPAGPASATTAAQREAILLHELSHFTRGDVWKQAALQLLAAAQWFNPWAWIAARKFAECGEWLSDADAASTPQQRIDLATALTRIAAVTHTATPVLTHNAAGRPLSQRITRLVRSPLNKVSPMKKCLMIAVVAGIALTQLVRLEVSAAEQAPTSLEGVKAAVEELNKDLEKLKTAVRGLKTRGEKLKLQVETKVEELKTLAAKPEQVSDEAKKRVELFKSGEEAKQLKALEDAASLGDEGLLLLGHAAKNSPHETVRQKALSAAASLKEKGLPALAISLDSVTNKDLIYLTGEIEKHQMADRILLYKALVKDADSDLQDAVLAAGEKVQQRALFIGSLAEKADASLLAKMLKNVKTLEGRDGLILLFAAAGAKDSTIVLTAVEAAEARGAEGLPVLAPAARMKDVKVRYAVVKAAKNIGGEAGKYIVDRCLQASEMELRDAATKAVNDAE